MNQYAPAPNRGKGKGFAFLAASVGHTGDACLIWPFSCDSHGYAQVSINGRVRKAYRLMCILAHGEPPTPKHHAGHNCGRGHVGCIHPQHLEWKTPSENQKDRAKHGTKNHGTNYGRDRKTTPADVEEIQKLAGHLPITQIAEMFGIKRGTVDYYHRKARERAVLTVD